MELRVVYSGAISRVGSLAGVPKCKRHEGVCEGSREHERGIDVAHRGQREGAQRSLSASLSAQSGEKANMDKEKSTGLNRFVIVCKAYVAKTPLPKGSGNINYSVGRFVLINIR
jgi:hypothetical protein